MDRLLRPGLAVAHVDNPARAADLSGEGAVCITGADDPAWDGFKARYRAWGHAARDGRSWWLGGRGPVCERAACEGPMPAVVSFYTVGTGYEAEAETLRACCVSLGLEHDIRGVASRGSWEANCAMKAAFVRDRWREYPHGVAWVDADARIARVPDLFRVRGADFAVHLCNGWQMASGTVCFWKTPGARVMLDRWLELCEADPARWDQVSLDLAWESVVQYGRLVTLWLPQSYTKIFDHRAEDDGGPVIEHHQASRRLKSAVTSGASRPAPVADGDLIEARRASRARATERMAG